MYDFWLGGHDSFAVDRAAALAVTEAVPEVKLMALENRNGTPASVSAIARAAGVDRSFLYRPRHRDLLAALHTAARQPPGPGNSPGASRASLQADLANSQDRCKRLAEHVALLEKRLSEHLGQDAWHQSGLDAAVDLDDLRNQVRTLEEANAGLRAKMEDLEDELDAARPANRELMTRANIPRSDSAASGNVRPVWVRAINDEQVQEQPRTVPPVSYRVLPSSSPAMTLRSASDMRRDLAISWM
jgi:hypothetical protein